MFQSIKFIVTPKMAPRICPHNKCKPTSIKMFWLQGLTRFGNDWEKEIAVINRSVETEVINRRHLHKSRKRD